MNMYSTAALRAHLSEKSLRRLVRTGDLVRIRRGWYATPESTPESRRAAIAGGVLTCVSALAQLGVWTMPHQELHVRVASGTSVRRAGVRLHWTHERVDLSIMDGAQASLVVAVECLDLRAAVVVVDSALNRGLVTRAALEHLLTSPRGRRVMALADAKAESGIETISRLALRRLRLRVRSQVTIAGMRVDFLIGDRLVLEVDGRRWHGDFEADRARDRRLIALGYLVIRASYRQVMDEWPEIETQILTLVRRNEHRWRATLPQGACRGPVRPE